MFIPPPPPPTLCQDVTESVIEAPRSTRAVTASGFSNQVITGAELAATGERSLPRALERVSGLFVQETNLGGGAPILRGLIGNQILIVVDGVRLNDATTRGGPNQSLNSIDPATVERIEVIRGPTSVLYGSDALGGTILIWTKNRAAGMRNPGGVPQAALAGELFGQYSSMVDGSSEGLGLSFGDDHHGLLGIASFHDWGDLRSAHGTVDNTGYDGLGWFGSWEHAYDSRRYFRLTASGTRDFDVPRTDRMNVGFGQVVPSDAENFFTLQDRKRYVLSYTDEVPSLADKMQWRLSLREYDERRQIRKTGSTTRALEEDRTRTLGVGADWRKALGGSQLFTWGFDVDLDDIESSKDNLNTGTGVITPSTGNFAPDSKYLGAGLFVQDEILAFDAFDLTAGARYSYFWFSFDDFTTLDRVEQDFSALTGSLQISRNLAPGVRLSGTLAQAFRAPNLSEVARNATFAGGTELANPDLDPEESLYQEVALDVVHRATNVSFGVYHNDIRDVVGRRLILDPTPGVPGDETYLRDNTGNLEYFGAELRVKQRLGDSQAPFFASAYFEYTRGAQDDDISGRDPASRVPPPHGSVSIGYEPSGERRGLSFAALSLVWAAGQSRLSPGDLGDPRIDPAGTDGWTRLDIDLAGPLGTRLTGTSWNVGLHNILDAAYRVHGSGFDAPGLNAVVGLRVLF